MFKPKLLLHAEGAAVLFVAVLLYRQAHASWGWFALLFFTPDFSMLGYLANQKVGALVYNIGHFYLTPLALLAVLRLNGLGSYEWLALIWIAHIGFDRLMGYGLKYETAFKDTHLQRV